MSDVVEIPENDPQNEKNCENNNLNHKRAFNSLLKQVGNIRS